MNNFNTQISDLMVEIEKLEEEVINIKYQLEEAKDKKEIVGIYSDPQWFRSATYACRIKEQQIKSKNRQILELKRVMSEEKNNYKKMYLELVAKNGVEVRKEREREKQKRLSEFDSVFVDVVKEKIKPKNFDRLVEITKNRLYKGD